MNLTRFQRGMLLGGALILPGAILWLSMRVFTPDIGHGEAGGPSSAAGPSRAAAGPIPAAVVIERATSSEREDELSGPPTDRGAQAAGGVVRCLLLDDASGAPIVRTVASVVARSEKSLRPIAVETDASGRFALTGLQPEVCSLQVACSGYLPQARAVRLDGSASPAELEIRLVRCEELLGQVVDATGAPIPGAMLRALSKDATGPESASTRSYSDGTFRLPGLRKGTWTLLAQGEGYRRSSKDISVPAPDRLRIELAVDPGFEVIVADETGATLEGVSVSVLNRTQGFRSSRAAATTGASGRVRLSGLPEDPAGALAIQAQRRGFLSWNRQVPAQELERGELRVVLSRGVAVSGKVVNETGEPVSGAEVRLQGGSKGVSRTLKTTSTGLFELGNLEPGAYTIQAVTAASGSSAPLDIDVKVNGGAVDLTLTLEAGDGVIAGRVVNADGRPVTLSPVTLSPGALRTVTDEGGRFRFAGIKRLDAGARYLVAAGGGKAARASREASLGDEAIELVAPKLGGVSGFVAGDSTIDTFEIALESTSPDAPASRKFRFSSGSSLFKLRGVEPGTYRLSLIVGGEVLSTVENVEVRPGEESGPIEVGAR